MSDELYCMPIQCFATTVDTLPPFDPPQYAELRDWWKKHPNADVRRLILEVQTLRYACERWPKMRDDRPLRKHRNCCTMGARCRSCTGGWRVN